MVNGGVTPLINAAEAQEMGYRIVIWPCFGITTAYLACKTVADELKSTGIMQEKVDGEGKVQGGIRELFELCGLSECAEFDRQCGGKGFAKGV
jgi:2-methylisocitrate lyase-like PEP mutase family enzyme